MITVVNVRLRWYCTNSRSSLPSHESNKFDTVMPALTNALGGKMKQKTKIKQKTVNSIIASRQFTGLCYPNQTSRNKNQVTVMYNWYNSQFLNIKTKVFFNATTCHQRLYKSTSRRSIEITFCYGFNVGDSISTRDLLTIYWFNIFFAKLKKTNKHFFDQYKS